MQKKRKRENAKVEIVCLVYFCFSNQFYNLFFGGGGVAMGVLSVSSFF
jgi:hypothetical protein